MDRRFLGYYRHELQHLREMSGEFAREFPKIAGRLSMDGMSCADPYVERLLEGFAFLTARVHQKLDAEHPRFTQALLETVYPHSLAPTPSMLIAQFAPDLSEGGLADGFPIPAGTVLRSNIGKNEQTPCEYRTAHEINLYPLKISEGRYHTQDLASLGLTSISGARAGIRLRLQATAGQTFDAILMDRLNLFLHGQDEIPSRILEQVIAHTIGVVVRPSDGSAEYLLPSSSVQTSGFATDQALIPFDARSFQGYRLVQEYMSLPQRFMFFDITGLRQPLARCETAEIDIIILLDLEDLELESRLDASCFKTFCSPAINLFPKRADRVHLTDRFSEFHVVPDRTRPLDFEVYRVNTVTGHGTRSEDEVPFRHFYAATDADAHRAGVGAYFSTARLPRVASSKEQRKGRRSSYIGSEVYVSLVDASAAPYRTDLKQLSIETLCTNRDLPLRMPVGHGATDFSLEISAPIESVRCIQGPSAPRPSIAEGEFAWRLISHLSLNYLSITDTSGGDGASGLREMLRLYGELADPAIRKQIDGLRAVSTKPVMRRVPTPGPIAFARGLEINVSMDELAFEGLGCFVLGAVIDQFLAKYVTINSFTETVVHSTERGELMRWPARLGQRPTI